MPTGFIPPPGRPNPSVNNNVTYALTYNPEIILMNYPSNDATNSYPMNEQITNYDTIVGLINQNNILLKMSTTQPRNLGSQSQLDLLFAMRDSTYSRYGIHAVDFWTDLAQVNGWINPIYNSGDGIHLNNAAHRILFERMRDAVVPLIIPVELASFIAVYSSNSIILQWETVTEKNNQGFEIQQSVDNVKFFSIGFVPGFGTSTEKHYYSYSDHTTLAGTIYYRLKQLDFDGSFNYSNSVEVTRVVSYELSQNYPNPFNPTTTISYAVPQNTFVTLKVYDILGSEVVELVNGDVQAGIHKVNFNAFDLNSGVYFYTFKASSFTETKKLMLMK